MDELVPSDVRQQVFEFEEWVRTLAPVEFPLRHFFAPGVYARELTIPAGTALTGQIHKYVTLNILSQGEMSVLTHEGVKRVSAPFTIVSPPGTKRAAIAHTKCVWTTIHGTDETDLEKIEEHFIAQTEQEYLEFCKVLEIGDGTCRG